MEKFDPNQGLRDSGTVHSKTFVSNHPCEPKSCGRRVQDEAVVDSNPAALTRPPIRRLIALDESHKSKSQKSKNRRNHGGEMEGGPGNFAPRTQAETEPLAPIAAPPKAPREAAELFCWLSSCRPERQVNPLVCRTGQPDRPENVEAIDWRPH
jgi:hypothetical protein